MSDPIQRMYAEAFASEPQDASDGEPTNAERAARASQTLDAYAHVRGEIADEADMRDLLADLMHFCNQRTDTDFEEELRMARANFSAEIKDE